MGSPVSQYYYLQKVNKLVCKSRDYSKSIKIVQKQAGVIHNIKPQLRGKTIKIVKLIKLVLELIIKVKIKSRVPHYI